MKLHFVILQNIITLNPHDIAIAMRERHNCVAVDRQCSEQSEVTRELKQQRQRRLRKRHLKTEFALLQKIKRLFHFVQFVRCWQFFVELNSKRLYQSSGKRKESRRLVFTSSTKREIRHFHVLVVP